MVHAYIMIRTAAGESQGVRDSIDGIGSIDEAHIVAGEFDIIAETDGDEVYDILSTAAAKVQAVNGVEETKTYVSLSG